MQLPSFVLFFFLVSFSQAAQRFLPYADLSAEKKSRIASIQGATRQLETQNGRCTGTTVSDSGDLLTARHCVQACLIRSGVFQQKIDPKSVEYYELNRSNLGKAECSVIVDGKESLWIVRHTSPGLVTKLEERSMRLLNRELFDRLRTAGYTASGDFVILSPKEKQHSPCISLSESEDVENGAEIFSLGFPSETHRPDGNNSSGEGLYFSQGKVMSFSEGDCYSEARPESRKELLDQFEESGTFISDLDAIFGSSGSAVYDANNRMVGILTNVYSPADRESKKLPENHYCKGAAKALKLNRIKELIGEELSSLRCEAADRR